MARAWWDRVWFSRFDPCSLGLFRISLGLLLLATYVALGPNWERYYGAEGILSLNDQDLLRRGQDHWSLFYATEGVVPLRAWWVLGLIASGAFALGWHTRLWTVVLYALQVSLVHRNWMVVNGEDLVCRMLLFYSCFAPLGRCLSIDAWRRRRRAPPGSAEGRPPLVWAARLMQVNVALIYLLSLASKLTDSAGEWIRGDMMYWAMMSDMWGRWPWPAFFYEHGAIMSRLATYGTVLIEGAFPLLVWFRRPKLTLVAAVTLLHLGIAVVIPNVTFFTLSMVCAMWVFVPGETAHRWVTAAGRGLRRIASPSPMVARMRGAMP